MFFSPAISSVAEGRQCITRLRNVQTLRTVDMAGAGGGRRGLSRVAGERVAGGPGALPPDPGVQRFDELLNGLTEHLEDIRGAVAQGSGGEEDGHEAGDRGHQEPAGEGQ